MSKTCKICQNILGEFRQHCPTCGAFEVGSITYDIVNVQQLVVAEGVMRQNYARTVRIAVTSCDCDCERE